jgi:hypothetical protein
MNPEGSSQVKRGPLLDPAVKQFNSAQSFATYCSNNHSNIIAQHLPLRIAKYRQTTFVYTADSGGTKHSAEKYSAENY